MNKNAQRVLEFQHRGSLHHVHGEIKYIIKKKKAKPLF